VDRGNLRLKTEDIRDTVGLVPGLVGDLAEGVDEVNSSHPLVHGELNLASEVVEMTNEGGKDLPVSGGHLGTHCVDDILGEVGVKSVRWPRLVALRTVALHAGCAVCCRHFVRCVCLCVTYSGALSQNGRMRLGGAQDL
jgi:hypothetical protein